MITHDIRGNVLHVPDTKTPNKFLIMGEKHTDGVRQPGDSIRRFRLVEEDRVKGLVESLPRVEQAVMAWKDQERTGVLRLRLRPAQNATEAQRDAQNGGGERVLKVKDLLRDLTKDKDIIQSQAGSTVPLPQPSLSPGGRGDGWEIPPLAAPKIEEEELPPPPPQKKKPMDEPDLD